VCNFNEFISDALTQENNNAMYTTSKSHKRAYDAGASQSKAPVTTKSQYRPPTTNVRYRPTLEEEPNQDGFSQGLHYCSSKECFGAGQLQGATK
jgi:hypothetical protein